MIVQLNWEMHKVEFSSRLNSARMLVQAANESTSRMSRGLAIVLVYGAYEYLLTSMCRSILEAAVSTGLPNGAFRPGIKLFIAYGQIDSITKAGPKAIWRTKGKELLSSLGNDSKCTINPDIFPTDGSHMRRSQVSTFCEIFELDDPAIILKEVWEQLDTFVAERNAIAHGRETAEDIGRRYSANDIMGKLDIWESRWMSFIDHVYEKATLHGFYARL